MGGAVQHQAWQLVYPSVIAAVPVVFRCSGCGSTSRVTETVPVTAVVRARWMLLDFLLVGLAGSRRDVRFLARHGRASLDQPLSRGR